MDTGTGRSCPRGPAIGPHRCRCWCTGLDCKHRSLHNGVRQNRCSTGTRTPPLPHQSSIRPCPSSRRSRHNYRFSWSPLGAHTVPPTARRPLQRKRVAKLINVKARQEKLIPRKALKNQAGDIKLKYVYSNKLRRAGVKKIIPQI